MPRLLATIVAVLALGAGSPATATPAERPFDPRLHALLINGGGSAAQNYQSHMLHVRELVRQLLAAGMPPERIAVFASDGSDPGADLTVRDRTPEGDFWLLRGTRFESRLGSPLRQVSSELPGFEPLPATREALRRWFTAASARLRPGDTLFLYVTDHGTENRQEPGNNRITLWGKDESLSVRELDAMLDGLSPGVRVVSLMSQCFSGGFARLALSAEPSQSAARGRCGYFSSTDSRPAYGCYAENRDLDNVGHSFEFLRALETSGSFASAHAATLVADSTPDVPLRTSDIFLHDLLRRAAEKSGETPSRFTDRMLEQAWAAEGRFEPEIRLLDAIGQAFGWFSPRSLAELDGLDSELPAVLRHLTSYSKAWKDAADDLKTANLDRFLERHPPWAKRLAVNSPEPLPPAALRDGLLRELVPFTRTDARTAERLESLRGKSEDAAAVRYRMEVREAALLRMRWILERVAGQMVLSSVEEQEARSAFAGLSSCEELALPVPRPAVAAERAVAPYPSYADDIRLAEATLPAWIGIKFRQADETLRSELGLSEGAVAVEAVYPDSPAKAAGLEPGDLVLGPPGLEFREKSEIREWTMLRKVGVSAPLVTRRGEEWRTVAITPAPYPLKWPELKGPPKANTAAPALHLTTYRGPALESLAGRPHLLYFWATWCAPCKAALPELLAFESARGVPIVAITDEPSARLDQFFAKRTEAFPEIVATDAKRRTSLDYGVSGTPTFIYVDAHGVVQSVRTGYSPASGIGVPAWSWKR